MASRHVSIPVAGIGCAAPSMTHALSRLLGVVSVYVNPATELAEIDFDEEHVSVDRLARAIDRCGFHSGQPMLWPDRSRSDAGPSGDDAA